MIMYNLINPSDPYTFVAKNREVAALTVLSFGLVYGAMAENGDSDLDVPVFLLTGSEAAEHWYLSMFNRSVSEGFKDLKKDVISALDSFVIGNCDDRKKYEVALKYIKDKDKENFKKEWQEAERSSLSEYIGCKAYQLAEKLRKELN